MANWVKEFLEANPDVAVKPVADRGQFHYAVKNPDGSRTYYFTELPNHYYKDGEWKPLDTKLVYYANTDEYGAEGIQTRLKLNGGTRILDAIYNHTSLSVGKFDEATKTFTVAATLPDGVVTDDSIIRSIGKFTHKITLTETGLREYMIINSAVPATADEWLVLQTEITVPKPQEYSYSCPTHGDTCIPDPDAGVTPAAPAYICSVDGEACDVTALPIENKQLWPDGWVDDTNIGKYQFPKPTGVDAAGKEIPTRRYAIFKGGKQYLLTGIKGSNLTGVTYPITIDPDYLDMTADGYIYGYQDPYSTARSTSYSFYTALTTFAVGQYFEDPKYYVYRSFLKFNTLTLPSADTITQVNLKLTATIDNSTTDFDVQIVKQNWSAQDPIATGNKEAAYDNCLAGTADSNIWRNTSGMAVNTTYTSGNLDTTYPTKGGYTYYSLRSSRDYGNITPSGIESILLASQEHATAAYRPVLVITATAKALSGYTYKKEIYLDTKADAANVATDQSSFPIAVHINSSSWSTGAELARILNAANTDGKRVNFYTNADQTWPLNYEVEYFSAGTEAVYWIGVPTVKGNYNESDGTLNTLLVGYEDGSGWPAADQSNKVGVWDSNFKMVQHMKDTTTSTITDSTFNANNGTKTAANNPIQATGQVKYGQTFDGTDDIITISGSSLLSYDWTNFSFSAFVSPVSGTSANLLEQYYSNPTYPTILEVYWDNVNSRMAFRIFKVATEDKWYVTPTNSITVGQFYHIAVTHVQDNTPLIYINAVSQSLTQIGGGVGTNHRYTISSSAPTYIGRNYGGGSAYGKGTADEIRLSSALYSADWIKLECYSMKKTAYNGDTGVSGTGYPFVSWGSEQGGAPATRCWGTIIGV